MVLLDTMPQETKWSKLFVTCLCFETFYGFENHLSLVDTPQSRFKMSFAREHRKSVARIGPVCSPEEEDVQNCHF
jgi:hypothetical protein